MKNYTKTYLFYPFIALLLLLSIPQNTIAQTILPQQDNAVLGGRSVLLIRGFDPATHTWDVSDADIANTQMEMENYVQESSFNKAWIETFDITPVYEFTVGGNLSYTYMSGLIGAAAEADGYVLSDYNVVIYSYRSTTDLDGAGALGIGNGLNGSVWMPGQLLYAYKGVIHESYHAFGNGHAENIEGEEVMFPGPSNGGHDPYHFMGSEQGAADVPAFMKYRMGWIDPSEIQVRPSPPTACETIKIHETTFVQSYNATHNYAIQLGDDLWISYVTDLENPNLVDQGVLLHYIPGTTGLTTTRILDTEPNTISVIPPGVGSNYAPVIDFWDAAMEVGDEIYWNGTIIKVVSTGGTGEQQWAEVEICDCLQLSGDSDNDGICDSFDVCDGFDDSIDSDFDQSPDGCDICPNSPTDDSNNDGICDNVQCLNLTTEPFDYDTSIDLNTANGGQGFEDSWNLIQAEANANVAIEAASLDYEPLGNSIGNKLVFELSDETEGIILERNLDIGFVKGEYMWVSCLLKATDLANGGMWLRPNGQQTNAIGKRWGNTFGIDNNSVAGITMAEDEVYLLVARYYLEDTQTTTHLWINPSPADLLDVNTAGATKVTSSMNSVDSFVLRLEKWGAGDYEIDEFKVACQAPEITTPIGLEMLAYLQGPLINSPTASLMRDDLRANNLIPTIEPYTALANFSHYGNGGGETIDASLLADNGAISVVDWLLIELRDKNDPSIIVETQSVLVKRNGQVVDANNNINIQFDVSDEEYYVALRHRNHLGVMTKDPINLTTFPLVDFTNSLTPIYGTNALKAVNATQALWAGNCLSDDKVIFTGDNNEVNVPFFEVLTSAGNPSNTSNYIEEGYHSGDVDLNGETIFQGANNDINPIFFNVLTHPQNPSSIANYIIQEQLP